MRDQFVASTRGTIVVRENAQTSPIHDVPSGYEAEFNAITESRSSAVMALFKVFRASNVECDPRNRAVLIQNLRDMRITGDGIVVALNSVCGGDASDFAEKVYAQSPELAESVHKKTHKVTFSRERVFAD